MNIWELDKLILFLIFFIPGFVSLKVYDLLIPNQRRDISKSVYEIVAFSALNFAVFFWLIELINQPEFRTSNPFIFYFSLSLIFLAFPAAWPFLYIKLYDWEWFAKNVVDLSPTAWDYHFRCKQTYWVIVHLKDKRKIGGLFGLNSYASTYPNEEQVYLEEVWKLDSDGRFLKKIDRTKGIIILKEDILAIEFFN